MTFIPTTDYFIEVARGNVSGQSIFKLQGINPSIGTTFEDIWDVAGQDLVLPTSAETWEVVSTNANDSAAGTGTRVVIVESLDINYVTQSQIVVMNGVT